MAYQASAHVERGWINSSDRLHGGRVLVRNGRGNLLFSWECFFIFHSGWLLGHLYGDLYLQQTHFPPHPELNGVVGGVREVVWEVVWPWWDLSLFSSCSADQEDGGGAGFNVILGQGPWRLGKGWCLAEWERPRICWILEGWVAAGWPVQVSWAAELA